MSIKVELLSNSLGQRNLCEEIIVAGAESSTDRMKTEKGLWDLVF